MTVFAGSCLAVSDYIGANYIVDGKAFSWLCYLEDSISLNYEVFAKLYGPQQRERRRHTVPYKRERERQ